MANIANKAVSSAVGKVSSAAKNELSRLTNYGKESFGSATNIEVTTFPTNLENQAQSTYMAIYIFDNKNNQEQFVGDTFVSEPDDGTWEIGAVTWLKDQGQQAAEWAKSQLNTAKDYLVKSAKDYLVSLQNTVLKDTTEALGIKREDAEYAWDWANKWVIPHRKVSKSRALQNSLDPVNNPDANYKLVKAIHIQMPSSSLTYKYENGWESTDTSTLNAIKTLLQGVKDLFGDDKQNAAGKQKINSLLTMVGDKLGDVVTGGGYTASKQSRSGQVYNPVVVFNYTIPSPRTFSYSFSLYPRNVTELYTIFNMIQMLKYYSLPTVAGKSDKNNGGSRPTMYNYPAKFAIKFFTNGYENKWFPKTMSLGLTSIEESLTGEGGDMAYFENYFDTHGGNPPRMVNLTLTFKELGILTREYAKEGY